MNRLRWSRSPYLLQHADNPVDWWPVGREAFAASRSAGRARPALGRVRRLPLVPRDGARVVRGRRRRPRCSTRTSSRSRSTGRSGRTSTRSTWHATQALTGQGGWPMTVFLTPDRRPSTPAPTSRRRRGTGCRRSGRCSRRSATAWRDRRDEVRRSARPASSAQLAERARRGAPGGLSSTADWPRPWRRWRQELRRGARRVRRRAQVPAVDGAGGPAARRRRATALIDGRPDPGGDGPRRNLRPARRRLRPLQRRRRLGGAALREDALRQRAAARGLRALVAAHRRPAGRAGGRARRRLAAARDAHRRRAPSPPAWTPTPSTSGSPAGGRVLRLDAGPARRACSAPRTATWAADAFTVTAAGHLRGRRSTLQLLRRTRRPAAAGRRPGPAAGGARTAVRVRAGTTRWSRPGTAG